MRPTECESRTETLADVQGAPSQSHTPLLGKLLQVVYTQKQNKTKTTNKKQKNNHFTVNQER